MTSPRGGPLVVVLGDNVFEHAHARRHRARGASDADGALIFVKDVPDPEAFGVVVYGEDGRVDRHRREGRRRRHSLRAAADERRGRRPLLLPGRRVRRDRQPRAVDRAASSRSPTSTATTRSEGRLDVPSRCAAGGRTRASTGTTWPRSAAASTRPGRTGRVRRMIEGWSASRCAASRTSAAGSASCVARALLPTPDACRRTLVLAARA